ncbi:MAG TPA: PQQ-binding-like beta-propeller repeat protein [Spirochaetota bacterium]|nr:PQQ-binding-like beta-propeller repeat protein [Spirochaetota bacterium]
MSSEQESHNNTLEQMLKGCGTDAVEIPDDLDNKIADTLARHKDRIIKKELRRHMLFMWLKGGLVTVSLLLAATFVVFDIFSPERSGEDLLDYQAYTSVYNGNVTVKPSDSIKQKVVKADTSFKLEENQKITLDKKSKVVIYPKNMGSITANAGTVLTPVSLPGDRLHVKLHKGKLLASVNPLEVKDSFLIETALVNLTVKGTLFEVEANTAEDMQLKVYEGIVHLDFNDYFPYKTENLSEKVEKFYHIYKNYPSKIHSNDFVFLKKFNRLLNQGVDMHKGQRFAARSASLDKLKTIFNSMVKNISGRQAVVSRKDIDLLQAVIAGKKSGKKQYLKKTSFNITLPDQLWSAPLTVNQHYFTADKKGNIFLISPDGTIRRRNSLEGEVQGGAVYNGREIVVSTLDNKIHFIDPATLKVVSSFKIAAAVGSDIVYDPDFKYFYIASHNGDVTCFHKEGVVWETSTIEGIFTDPVIVRNKLVVFTQNGKTFAYNAVTGKLEWAANLKMRIRMASPVTLNGRIFIRGARGGIKAMGAEQGSLNWSKSFKKDQPAWLVKNKNYVLAVSKKGVIRALDPDSGNIIWSRQTGKPVSGSPAAALNKLILPQHKFLAVHDIKTGQELFSCYAGVNVKDIYADNNKILTSSSSGNLQRFYLKR